MNGILVIDKQKNVTSRDIVNIVCKKFNTKKVGHTGTLDPIATGVLVITIGKATRLVEVLTNDEKEYIAEVKLGILTDTYDITGSIIDKKDITLDKIKLKEVLNSFVGKYNQEVPIYSAVKVNGKKLYEYARKNEKIELPKREVEIKKIELLECNNDYYRFKVLVSKGTYIRSLIKDINDKLGIIGTMSDLIRIRQGKFTLDEAYTISDIENNNYKILSINDVLKNENCVTIDDNMYKLIKNGSIIDNTFNAYMVTFIYKDNVVAIYKKYDKDSNKLKPYKMFV